MGINGEVFKRGTKNIAADKKSILKIFYPVGKLIAAIALFFVFASVVMADVVVQGSTINVDNKLYVDPSTGNVGIGITSPSAPLSIVGSPGDSNSGTLILGPTSSTNLRMGYNTVGGYSWIQSHFGQPLRINELGNNVIFNSGGGNVGIGTTSPGMPLEVSTGNSNLGLRIRRSTPGAYYSDIIHTAPPEGLAFIVGDGATATEKMRITATGNVGIGTANPGALLHINDNAAAPPTPPIGTLAYLSKADAITPIGFMVGWGAGGGPRWRGIHPGGTAAAASASTAGSVLFGIEAGGHDGSAYQTGVAGAVYISALNTWSASDRSTQIQFQTTPSGSTALSTAMTIVGSDVGIGTIPTQKLDVAGQIHSTGDICTDAGGGRCLGTVSGAASGWTDSGTTVQLTTITDSVGIGTTTPATKLEVAGGPITMDGTNNYFLDRGAGNVFRFCGPNAICSATSSLVAGRIQLSADGSLVNAQSLDPGMGGIRAPGSSWLATNAGSRVGIGTTSPGMPLEVSTGNSALGLRIRRFTPGAYYSDIIHTAPPEGLAFIVGDGTTATEKMRITGAGNVVIGGGANIVVRCTTAGALPVGALTVNAASCGASTDTKLRVP